MIRRVDIDRQGGMILQLGMSGNEQWYDLGTVPPSQLEPSNDPAIPLSGFIRNAAQDSVFSVLNYRPSRRLVLKHRKGEDSTVLKGYRRGKCVRHVERFQLAARALENGNVQSAEILDIDQQKDFIEMAFIEGPRPAISSEKTGDFVLLGAGVKQLQSYGEDCGVLDLFRREDELAVLDERIRRLRLAGGNPPDGWVKLRELLSESASLPGTVEPVLTHRDMHDGQWLLSKGKPCLLDFDLLCKAEPELDPANFLAHLALRRLQDPDSVTGKDEKACCQAFFDGLGLPQTRESRARLHFYQAATFARLALVYQLRPKWQIIVPDLLDLGRHHLRLTNAETA